MTSIRINARHGLSAAQETGNSPSARCVGPPGHKEVHRRIAPVTEGGEGRRPLHLQPVMSCDLPSGFHVWQASSH